MTANPELGHSDHPSRQPVDQAREVAPVAFYDGTDDRIVDFSPVVLPSSTPSEEDEDAPKASSALGSASS